MKEPQFPYILSSMTLVLATGNPHKKEEIRDILPKNEILIPADLGIDFDFEETGSSFLENSLGKALALFKLIQKPVLADDSGLCVDALKGAPGIYSARFGAPPGGPDLESPERNALLLKTMTGLANRTAFFVCAMVLVLDEYRIFTVQETIQGEILTQPLGTGGFGYDPLFYIPALGKTMAELSAEEKNSLSHRGRAGKRMAALLKDL